MNGETGKIAGDLPISGLKSFLFFLLFFVLITAITFLLAFAICDFESEKIFVSALIGLIVGVVGSIGGVIGLRRLNKNVHFQYGAAQYEKENSCYINMRKDIYLYKKVSKRAKPKNNK
jgi:hypothetical protein